MKTKTVACSLAAMAILGQAQTIQVTPGWHLMGAVETIRSKGFDNHCVDLVWKYTDNAWQLHIANDKSYSVPSDIKTFSTIQKGEGFWVKGNGDCTIDLNASTPENNTSILKIKEGDTFYEFKVRRDEEGLDFQFNSFSFADDGHIKFIEKHLQKGQWVEDEEDHDLDLTENGWENEDYAYTINPDGSITFEKSEKVSIVEAKDISGNYPVDIEDSDRELNVTMPEGAREYRFLDEHLKDRYTIWKKQRTHGNIEGQEYYTSFKEFIEHQCGTRWFLGDHDGGVAFAGTKDANGDYVCDGSATGGKLFEVHRGDPDEVIGDGGTWEIKTVYGQKVMIIHPKNQSYWDEGFLPIFAEYDGYLWKGEMLVKGKKHGWNAYNQIAAEAFKKAAEAFVEKSNDLRALLSGKTLYSYEWDEYGIWRSAYAYEENGTQSTVDCQGHGENWQYCEDPNIMHWQVDGQTLKLSQHYSEENRSCSFSANFNLIGRDDETIRFKVTDVIDTCDPEDAKEHNNTEEIFYTSDLFKPLDTLKKSVIGKKLKNGKETYYFRENDIVIGDTGDDTTKFANYGIENNKLKVLYDNGNYDLIYKSENGFEIEFYEKVDGSLQKADSMTVTDDLVPYTQAELDEVLKDR